jgi:GR25 family glycosyltransferase involved in LPS biosynthesis
MTPQLPCVPVFVISLTQRPRCDALCATLSRLDIPFQMVQATDVSEWDPRQLADVYDESRAMRRLGRPMGRAEIGCALSHCGIYRRMLEQRIPLALVLEEDAVPGHGFKAFWQASASIPEDIDLVSLYSEEGYVRCRASGRLADCTLHEATVSLANTVGYYVRLECASRLMRGNNPVSMVADWPLDLRAMRQLLVLPMLVEHPATGSTIANNRPPENVLRRYRVPSWFSGLFHLSYLGYVMQPDCYEGLSNYYHREVSRRLRRISAPAQISVRSWLARTRRARRGARERSFAGRIRNRVRLLWYSFKDAAAGRETVWSTRRFRTTGINATSQKARLKIAFYTNWLDFSDALRFLTPAASGVWNDVAFVPAGSGPTDWVGIFNQPRERVLKICSSPDRVFFAIGEPPTRMHRPLHLGQGHGTTVFTCDREVVTQTGADRNYVLTPPMLRTWSVRRSLEQLSTTAIREKPRLLSWITSDISLLAGHRRRLEFLERLRKGLEFDLFGRGYRRVYDKWDVLAPYRYSIAFENVRAPWYFTEKLMDCYVCETMPIYVGDPTITNFFPAESLVVIDPDAPDVIEQIRSVIQSDAWRRNRDALLEAKRRVLHEYNAMLSRLVTDRTATASAPVRMTFAPLELAPDDDTGVA